MKHASSFAELYEQLKIRLVPFTIAFFVTVFMTYLVLYIIDIYPEPVTEEASSAVAADAEVNEPEVAVAAVTKTVAPAAPPAAPVVSPHPVSITFDALERTVPVLNPESPEYSVLDAALTEGVVRHPQSADLQDTGNMLILGHSSYLPNVLNKNFQAFNGMQKLAWGDIVRVTSADTEYVYRVDRVYESPASNIFVPVGDDNTAKLTLVTCNVLGAKEDRYILEATLIEKVALGA